MVWVTMRLTCHTCSIMVWLDVRTLYIHAQTYTPVQVADKRIAQLQVSVETSDGEKAELQQAILGMRQQVLYYTYTCNHSHIIIVECV